MCYGHRQLSSTKSKLAIRPGEQNVLCFYFCPRLTDVTCETAELGQAQNIRKKKKLVRYFLCFLDWYCVVLTLLNIVDDTIEWSYRDTKYNNGQLRQRWLICWIWHLCSYSQLDNWPCWLSILIQSLIIDSKSSVGRWLLSSKDTGLETKKIQVATIIRVKL